jgi:hypothetical protein
VAINHLMTLNRIDQFCGSCDKGYKSKIVILQESKNKV